MMQKRITFLILYLGYLVPSINYANSLHISHVLKMSRRKLHDTYVTRTTSDEEYGTHEDTSYYEEKVDDEKEANVDAPWYQPQSNSIIIKKLKLPVDHFNKANIRRWTMTCIQSTRFWRHNGLIYLFVKGNRPMKYNELKEGIMYDMANESGGVMFTADHRYYGAKNNPEDFSFLNSDQAIQDLIALIKRIKKEPEYKDSKVILVGGGYGGSLAVWLKLLYPTSADVVLASGARLLAKVDFKEYFMHVANAYKKFMPAQCADNIKIQLYTYDYCLNQTFPNNLQCLKRKYSFFDVCKFVDLWKPENKQLFYLSELSLLSDSVERGVRQMFRTCKNIKEGTRNRETSMFWDQDNLCFNYDMQRFIELVKENAKYRNFKRWLYQCCNEFGFFPTTAAYPDPLSSFIPIEFYYSLCSNLFGRQFNEHTINEKIYITNQRYGGLRPQVDNVVFVYGEIDPWQHVGAVERISETTETLVIPGVSHCKDLEPRNRSDTRDLKMGRKQIKEFIKGMVESTL